MSISIAYQMPTMMPMGEENVTIGIWSEAMPIAICEAASDAARDHRRVCLRQDPRIDRHRGDPPFFKKGSCANPPIGNHKMKGGGR